MALKKENKPVQNISQDVKETSNHSDSFHKGGLCEDYNKKIEAMIVADFLAKNSI